MGTKAAPRRIATIGPNKKPRASRPTTTSIFFDSLRAIVVEVRWWIRLVMRVSNATGFLKIGKISRKTIP